VVDRVGVRAKELRQQAVAGTDHKRTPEITAQLGAALEQFLIFARETGAIADDRKLWAEWWGALCHVNREQAAQQAESNPAQRFIELLRSAISAGGAHAAAKNGDTPDNPRSWGWRQEGADVRPAGLRVGWVDGDDLYLDFDSAYRVVQEHGRAAGEALTVTPGTLRKRLDDAGLLKSVDKARGTKTIRKVLEGSRPKVLHLDAKAFLDASNGQFSANWSGRSDPPGPTNQPQNGVSASKEANWSDRSDWSGKKEETSGTRGRP
jgi:hypothetical protein